MDRRGWIVSLAGLPRRVRGRPWLFTGIHLLDPRLLDRLPAGPSDSVRDLYAPLVAEGERVAGVPLEGAWYDLGSPTLYLESQLSLLAAGFFLYPLAQFGLEYLRAAAVAPTTTIMTTVLVGTMLADLAVVAAVIGYRRTFGRRSDRVGPALYGRGVIAADR